jgi:sugar phosphate isomerase/epimerase
MKLGMVTYNWAQDWDLPTVIKNCETTGFEGVELRTTHKHGVEPTLNAAQREDVRKRFADSKVELVGLGSICEFQGPEPEKVKQNIETAKQFVVLSHDVGGHGVKVRPNHLIDGEDRKKTVERIGTALRECGDFAAGYGQQIRVEVHGKKTSEPAVIKEIMDVANHPQVRVCWNSNPGETINGSLKRNFDLLKDRLGETAHINNLYDPAYPYRELFSLLKQAGFEGFCLAECPPTSDPIRLMQYYRALWLEQTKG